MKISTIREILNADVVCGEDFLDDEVHSACGSDMMSDVLAYVKDQAFCSRDFAIPRSSAPLK